LALFVPSLRTLRLKMDFLDNLTFLLRSYFYKHANLPDLIFKDYYLKICT